MEYGKGEYINGYEENRNNGKHEKLQSEERDELNEFIETTIKKAWKFLFKSQYDKRGFLYALSDSFLKLAIILLVINITVSVIELLPPPEFELLNHAAMRTRQFFNHTLELDLPQAPPVQLVKGSFFYRTKFVMWGVNVLLGLLYWSIRKLYNWWKKRWNKRLALPTHRRF